MKDRIAPAPSWHWLVLGSGFLLASACKSEPAEPVAPPESRMVALTPIEYNHTIRDLLGMPIVGGSSNMQKNNIANRLGLASEESA